MNEDCPICGRELGGKTESHHLLPRTFRTRTNKVHFETNKVTIHSICHQKIHATFSENELYNHFHTVERLLEHAEMQKFINWVKKKPLNFYSKNNDTQHRKNQR